MACSIAPQKVQCGAREYLNTDPGIYNYNTDLSARVHPGATCIGVANGAGKSCSFWGNKRQTVTQIGDPVLIQRSYFSSGCPPGQFNDIKDTLSEPTKWINPEGIALNNGACMTSYSTRNFIQNVPQVQEIDTSRYTLFPNMWTSGYHGLNSIGGNKPARQIDLCQSNEKYRKYANEGISKYSYGSYGVAP